MTKQVDSLSLPVPESPARARCHTLASHSLPAGIPAPTLPTPAQRALLPVTSPSPSPTLGSSYYDHPHFIEEDTEKQRGEALSWPVTDLQDEAGPVLHTPLPQALLRAAYPKGLGPGQWGTR